MKKLLVCLLIAVVVVSMAFIGIGCKTTTTTETTAAATTVAETTASETTAAETTAPVKLTDLTFVTPRGSIEVMDDYNLWVAKELGYFEELGINLIMEPGPIDAFTSTKFLDQKKADVSVPSPGILASSVDSGMDVIGIYAEQMTNVFSFAVRKDSSINSVQDLKGKSISVADAGWSVVIDPILYEIGIDPKTVTYIVAGAQWGQAVSLGKADAALSWRGLMAQWDAQGLDLKYFLGDDFSKMPANGYVARKSDLSNPEAKQLLIGFIKAATMGIEFTRSNPRAAAQITYSLFKSVQEQMSPELAMESMRQLHWGYTATERLDRGYGWYIEADWQKYLDIVYALGQTEKHLTFEEIATNELIEEGTNFDRQKVEEDAKNYTLNDVWKDVKVTGNW